MTGGGSLKSQYHQRRKFYSTCFNMPALIKLISEYGVIEDSFLLGKKNKRTLFDKKYMKDKTGIHRNGRFLTLRGTWK